MFDSNWLVIPLTAGFIGYATNWLAIKMLFRPFQAHWYTLGWQGIIPRTRDKLAENVAKVVAERLVTGEELSKTLSSDTVRSALENGIYWGISNSGDEIRQRAFSIQLSKYIDAIATPMAESMANNADIANTIDTVAANVVRKAMLAFGSLPRKKLAVYLAPIKALDSADALRERIHFLIAQSMRNTIHSTLYSGESINGLFPNWVDTGKLAAFLTKELTPLFSEFFASKDIADKMSDIIIQYKEEQFSENVADRMKLGAVNIFFGDDRIRELVQMKLPELSSRIMLDQSIQQSIRAVIQQKLNALVHAPITILIAKLGEDNYYKFLHTISVTTAQRALPADLFSRIHAILQREADDTRTIADILASYGIQLQEMVPQAIGLSSFIKSENIVGKIRSLLKLGAGSLSLTPSQISKLSIAAAGWIIRLLLAVVPAALRFVNIRKLVDDKIKSLDLYDVEDMLFSFMRNHFKWINILGFVIGAIVGLGQVIFIKLLS